MSAPARIAGYAAAAIGRMNGTELEASVAAVVGWLLATSETFPSSADIMKAHEARTGRLPAYGTVARVVTMLRAAGVTSWQTAHVRRFHGDTVPEGAIVPVRQADDDASPVFRRRRYLLPVRRQTLVGFAETVANGGVAPVADSIVSDARRRLGSRVEPAREDPPPPLVSEKSGTRLSPSIESAPSADESAPESGLSDVARLFATLRPRPPG